MDFGIDPVTIRAIRKHPHRAADIAQSFSQNQLKSKYWLLEKLGQFREQYEQFDRVNILGSWYGHVLVTLLLENFAHPSDKIRLVDIDEEALQISRRMWLRQGFDDRILKEKVDDVTTLKFRRSVIINSSCEHMPAITAIEPGSLCILQSNDYREVVDHINCVDSPEQLADQYRIQDILYIGELDMEKYTRFMVIGYR